MRLQINSLLPTLEDKAFGEESLAVSNPYISQSISYQRQRLPIFQVIVGETGSGKSTQVAQYLLEAGWTKDGRAIAVTQPRRIAAVTLASRVAEEVSCVLGDEVGYCVRFDSCFKPLVTKIKYMTDGILIRDIMSDPLLRDYCVVMIDEAHERTIYTDIILGLLRKIAKIRKDLKIIVSSATLDAEKFRDYFNFNDDSEDKTKDTATILSVEGRTYPVSVFYTKRGVPDYVKATVEVCLDIHRTEPTGGDILVFLAGQDEVEMATKMFIESIPDLKKHRNLDKLWVVPMYGGLPAREQFKAFDSTPAGTRKIVVATNVAETSVTIPGIVYVIDCGFMKLRAVNPKSMIESLVTVPISQASAEQRAGRAGRLKPGKAFRLFTEEEFAKLLPHTLPEILRTDLSPVILQLHAMGIQNILSFKFPVKPPRNAVIAAYDLLHALATIDEEGLLTNPLGLQMAEFPLPPMHAKTLLESSKFDCSEEILTIIAMLQVQNVFVAPAGDKQKADKARFQFAAEEGDHLTMFNVYKAFELNRNAQFCATNFLNYRGLCRAAEIRAQLARLLQRYKIPVVSCKGDADKIRKCLVNGFFANAAKASHTGEYVTVRGQQRLKVHQSSIICYLDSRPDWVIFNEVMQDSIRDITVIKQEWLLEIAPHYFQHGTERELLEKRLKAEYEARNAVKKQRVS